MTTTSTIPVSPFGSAPRQRPTRQHKLAIWECMLGTVYAMNGDGEVRYFDFDYAAARAFAGVDVEGSDPRVAKTERYTYTRGPSHMEPRTGQLALWIVRPAGERAITALDQHVLDACAPGPIALAGICSAVDIDDRPFMDRIVTRLESEGRLVRTKADRGNARAWHVA